MTALILLIDQIVSIYFWTLLAYIAINWLVVFKIVNPWQPFVRTAIHLLGSRPTGSPKTSPRASWSALSRAESCSSSMTLIKRTRRASSSWPAFVTA